MPTPNRWKRWKRWKRWADRIVHIDGMQIRLGKLAELRGLTPEIAVRRFKNGWTVREIIETPLGKKRPRKARNRQKRMENRRK